MKQLGQSFQLKSLTFYEGEKVKVVENKSVNLTVSLSENKI
jgi:hypothetical protein